MDRLIEGEKVTLFELRALIESQIPWYVPVVLFLVANAILIISIFLWGYKK